MRAAIERRAFERGILYQDLVEICRKYAGRPQIKHVGQLAPGEARAVLEELKDG